MDDFRVWFEENKSKMTASAGIGKEDYNWWLKNVHLFPSTWEECLAVAEHEYARAIATLKLEEHRNRKLPPLEPVKTEAEFNRQWKETEYFLPKLLRTEEILTVPDFLVPIAPHPFETWAANHRRQGTALDFLLEIRGSQAMTEIIRLLRKGFLQFPRFSNMLL